MSMKSKKIVAEAMIAVALSFSALGLGAGVANAKVSTSTGSRLGRLGRRGRSGKLGPGVVRPRDQRVHQRHRSVGLRHRHRVHLAASSRGSCRRSSVAASAHPR